MHPVLKTAALVMAMGMSGLSLAQSNNNNNNSDGKAHANATATAAPSAVVSTIAVEKISPKIYRVKFTNPPVNLIHPETVSSLHKVVTELSEDKAVQVVIFTSGVSDYFYNHFNLALASQFPMLSETMPTWVDLVIRLTKAPFISIASIRGRTRGGGNELSLAFDLRYASKELAIFGQPEVGNGIVPGGGGSERLPRLIGRDRAMEVILSSADYNADRAESYGWITRAIPDQELDNFVLAMANRLASFDKEALFAAKKQINRASLPPDADLAAAYAEYAKSLSYPGFQDRTAVLRKLFAEKGVSELELNLGDYLGGKK